MPGEVPPVLLLIQLLLRPGKDNDLKTAQLVKPDSWLPSGPAPEVAVIWEVNQQIKISPSLSLYITDIQTNK